MQKSKQKATLLTDRADKEGREGSLVVTQGT